MRPPWPQLERERREDGRALVREMLSEPFGGDWKFLTRDLRRSLDTAEADTADWNEGLIYTGVVKEDSETQMALMDADGNVTRLDKDTIEETKEGKSGMPNDLHKALTMSELRDLVAFLADQKDFDSLPDSEKAGHGGE